MITATRVLLGAMAAGCFAVVATVVPALSLQAWLDLLHIGFGKM